MFIQGKYLISTKGTVINKGPVNIKLKLEIRYITIK